jgi:hypothetical protein
MNIFTVLQRILEIAIAVYIMFGAHLLYYDQKKRAALLRKQSTKKDTNDRPSRAVAKDNAKRERPLDHVHDIR